MTFMIISSAGGHMTELVHSLGKEFPWNKAKIFSYQNLMGTEYDVEIIPNPHRNLLKFAISFVSAVKLFKKYHPEYIISSGAGIALPYIIIGKLIFQKQIIFIESLAYIDVPTRTGRIAYFFSDLFIVHNEKLLKYYPKATVGKI